MEIKIKNEKRSVQHDQNNSKLVNENKENEFPKDVGVRITRQNKNSKTFNLNNSFLTVVVKQEPEDKDHGSNNKNSRNKYVTSDTKLLNSSNYDENLNNSLLKVVVKQEPETDHRNKPVKTTARNSRNKSNPSNYDEDVQIQNIESESVILKINDSLEEAVNNASKNNLKSIEKNALNKNTKLKSNGIEANLSEELHKKFTESKSNYMATQILNSVLMQVLDKSSGKVGASNCRTPIKELNGKTSYLKNQQLLFKYVFIFSKF